MVTYEQALAIAKEKRKNIGHCAEWENGFAFEPKSDGETYKGGFEKSPIIILKKDGSVTNMIGFIQSDGGTGELLREFDL